MTHPAEAATFDEIAEGLEAAKGGDAGKAAADALKAKLEGDTVPEGFRGKTVEEVLAQAGAFQSALAISEKARREAEASAAAARAAPPATPTRTEPPPEPVFGEAEFKKLYEEDPAAALIKLQEATERRMAKNFESRFVPLAASTAVAAEQQARVQFAEDFELFEPEINQFIERELHGDRSRITTPKAWNDLLAYIRGQPQNVSKLYEHRGRKAADAAKKEAEARAAATAGFSGTAAARRAPTEGGDGGQLDDTEKEIAKEFMRSGIIKSEAEYAQWRNIRR